MFSFAEIAVKKANIYNVICISDCNREDFNFNFSYFLTYSSIFLTYSSKQWIQESRKEAIFRENGRNWTPATQTNIKLAPEKRREKGENWPGLTWVIHFRQLQFAEEDRRYLLLPPSSVFAFQVTKSNCRLRTERNDHPLRLLSLRIKRTQMDHVISAWQI